MLDGVDGRQLIVQIDVLVLLSTTELAVAQFWGFYDHLNGVKEVKDNAPTLDFFLLKFYKTLRGFWSLNF